MRGRSTDPNRSPAAYSVIGADDPAARSLLARTRAFLMRRNAAVLTLAMALGAGMAPQALGEADRNSASQFRFEEYLRMQQPSHAPAGDTGRQRGRAAIPTQRRTIAAPTSPLRRPHVAVVHPATTVAVFGDHLGRALASGLTEAGGRLFWLPPGLGDDSPSEDVGLSSAGFDAWLASLKQRLARPDHPTLGVVMIGTNDRGPLKLDAETLEFGTPRWQAIYSARIDAVVTAFEAAKVRLIWVGLPPVRSGEASADYVRLNGLFRDRVTRGNQSFVDVWEAFLGEEGRFTPTGPDVSGTVASLRKADGISFTRAGARKLASFVEPDIKRLAAPTPAAEPETDVARITIEKPQNFDEALQIDVNAQIRREAGLPLQSGAETPASAAAAPAERPAAGPVLPLTAPAIATGGQLAPPLAQASLPAASATALAAHATVTPRPGRADDFAWPAKAEADMP